MRELIKRQLSSLEYHIIDLEACHIMDKEMPEIIEEINKLINSGENITKLELGNNNLTDQSIDALLELKNISSLNLVHNAFSDVVLPKLVSIAEVKSIDLERNFITDDGVAWLIQYLKDHPESSLRFVSFSPISSRIHNREQIETLETLLNERRNADLRKKSADTQLTETTACLASTSLFKPSAHPAQEKITLAFPPSPHQKRIESRP